MILMSGLKNPQIKTFTSFYFRYLPEKLMRVALFWRSQISNTKRIFFINTTYTHA